jgi:tetratricopeptide (TPR) repeat protein
MRRWLGVIAAFVLCAAPAAAAGPADCAAAPDVKCLAAEIFALAKTLPADNPVRLQAAFAERELAPGDVATALDYIVTDYPDPPAWDSIDWLAKAGRLDIAIKQAAQLKLPAERAGALLAVAANLLDRKDAARAQKLVEEAERQLPSIPVDELKYVQRYEYDRGQLWLRLGQIERAARIVTSTESLLLFADKYPAAAVKLRAQAWRVAERNNRLSDWKYVVEDAVRRGDQADAARAGERAGSVSSGGQTDAAIAIARGLSMAGLPEQAAKLIKPWPQWLDGNDATRTWTAGTLMPILAGLGRDQDVLSAARAIGNLVERSYYLGVAADEYVRLGRIDAVERLDEEALALAALAAAPDQKSDRDAVLHNLALARAGRGDIQGAFAVVAKLRDEARVRRVMSYVVRRAIDSDHTPVVGPAIEAMQEMAIAAQDAPLLLEAAERWYTVGSENKARSSLAQAMKMTDAGQAKLTGAESGLAAELVWRLQAAGKPEALIEIVDRIGVTDTGAIDHLVEIVRPVSPAVAVQLTARQTDVARRMDELAKIALQVAASGK